MVMGQASYFTTWYNRLARNNNPLINITLVFGAYDSPVAPGDLDHCEHQARRLDEFSDCQVHYIPRTTWTQGRNMLAADALMWERKRQRKFDFWTFIDDDALLSCYDSFEDDQRRCWQEFLDHVNRIQELSPKITTISSQWDKTDGWVGVSTEDAMLYMFRRDYVPYLLPYARPKKGLSEWLSQAALFCLMKTCFPSSVVSPPNSSMGNVLHRGYSHADFTQLTILDTIRNNFGLFVDLEHCAESDVMEQKQDWIGPYDTIDELIEKIPDHNLSQCAPLRDRFALWEQMVLQSIM